MESFPATARVARRLAADAGVRAHRRRRHPAHQHPLGRPAQQRPAPARPPQAAWRDGMARLSVGRGAGLALPHARSAARVPGADGRISAVGARGLLHANVGAAGGRHVPHRRGDFAAVFLVLSHGAGAELCDVRARADALRRGVVDRSPHSTPPRAPARPRRSSPADRRVVGVCRVGDHRHPVRDGRLKQDPRGRWLVLRRELQVDPADRRAQADAFQLRPVAAHDDLAGVDLHGDGGLRRGDRAGDGAGAGLAAGAVHRAGDDGRRACGHLAAAGRAVFRSDRDPGSLPPARALVPAPGRAGGIVDVPRIAGRAGGGDGRGAGDRVGDGVRVVSDHRHAHVHARQPHRRDRASATARPPRQRRGHPRAAARTHPRDGRRAVSAYPEHLHPQAVPPEERAIAFEVIIKRWDYLNLPDDDERGETVGHIFYNVDESSLEESLPDAADPDET
jgi:hypothetical protein